MLRGGYLKGGIGLGGKKEIDSLDVAVPARPVERSVLREHQGGYFLYAWKALVQG